MSIQRDRIMETVRNIRFERERMLRHVLEVNDDAIVTAYDDAAEQLQNAEAILSRAARMLAAPLKPVTACDDAQLKAFHYMQQKRMEQDTSAGSMPPTPKTTCGTEAK